MAFQALRSCTLRGGQIRQRCLNGDECLLIAVESQQSQVVHGVPAVQASNAAHGCQRLGEIGKVVDDVPGGQLDEFEVDGLAISHSPLPLVS